MMNEQFPVTVRRHLVATANERPADGQLETVLRLTAAAKQQQPWLIRLRWLVSPVAPYGNAALRFGLVLALLLIAVTILVVFAGGSPRAGSTVFEGRWTSIDPGDNSKQTLVVGAGTTPIVHFEDAYSIMCDQAGDTSTLFVAEGPGEIRLDRLIAHFPRSGCVTWIIDPFDAVFDYHAASDALIDLDGLIWHRLMP